MQRCNGAAGVKLRTCVGEMASMPSDWRVANEMSFIVVVCSFVVVLWWRWKEDLSLERLEEVEGCG